VVGFIGSWLFIFYSEPIGESKYGRVSVSAKAEIDPVGFVLSNFKQPAQWFGGAKSRDYMCSNGIISCN
jgi:hypothetical protein